MKTMSDIRKAAVLKLLHKKPVSHSLAEVKNYIYRKERHRFVNEFGNSRHFPCLWCGREWWTPDSRCPECR